MLKAAELALFDAGNRNILLMTADEGNGGADAAAAAQQLLAQGAEVIVGPLFGPSVTAVAPIARDRGVPVLAFSTEKSVAGNGVYLLSFLPQNEVRRVVSYAAAKGHHSFAAMVPQTAYGDVVAGAFNDAVESAGAAPSWMSSISAPNAGAWPRRRSAVAKSGADAVLIAQGGAMLRAIAPDLVVQRRWTTTRSSCWAPGLWDDDPTLQREAEPGRRLVRRARAQCRRRIHRPNTTPPSAPRPPQLASLAYDAVSLVALLSQGAALSPLYPERR